METPRFEDYREHAKALIDAALEAADPATALARHWDETEIGQGKVVLLAVGKGSRRMALEALRRLGKRVVAGVVTMPPEQVNEAEFAAWPVRVMACDHPFPTARNVEAARAVRELVMGARRDQTLVCLITGGGSAHLTLPWDGLTVEDIAAVTKALQRAGAGIGELNCVRKHCEQLKGGRLAVLSGAGRLRAYILSDVMGDRLDVIASGPTVADPTTFAEAIAVLVKRAALDVSPAVTAHLRHGALGEIEETPKAGDEAFGRVTNRIVASNRLVANAVALKATELGFTLEDVLYDVEGEAADVGADLGRKGTREIMRRSEAVALVIGGETTVTVGDRQGLGGPSQEMALAWAYAAGFWSPNRAAFLTLSTDGRDGPTDAAGGLVSDGTEAAADALGLDIEEALYQHDSYHLLEGVGALVKVPPTGTNLNHVAVVLTYP